MRLYLVLLILFLSPSVYAYECSYTYNGVSGNYLKNIPADMSQDQYCADLGLGVADGSSCSNVHLWGSSGSVQCASVLDPVCSVHQHLDNHVCVADLPPVCAPGTHLDSSGYDCTADALPVFGKSIPYPEYIYIKQAITGQSVQSDFSLIPLQGYTPYEFTTPKGTVFYDAYDGGFSYSFGVTMSFAAPYPPQAVALSVPINDDELAAWIVDYMLNSNQYAYLNPFVTDYFISRGEAFWGPFMGVAIPLLLDFAFTHWDPITGLFTDSSEPPNPEYSQGCTGGHSSPSAACLAIMPTTTATVFHATNPSTGVDMYYCMVDNVYAGNVGCGGTKSGGNFLSPAAVAGRIAALFAGNRKGGSHPRGKAGALGGMADDLGKALEDGFFGGKSGKKGPRVGKPSNAAGKKPPGPKRPRPDNDPEFDMVDCTDPVFMATQSCQQPDLSKPDEKPVFGKVDGGEGLTPTGPYKDALEITCKSGTCAAVNKGDVGGTPVVNKPRLPSSGGGTDWGKHEPVVKDLKVRSIPDSVKLIYDDVITHLGIPPKTTHFNVADCPTFTKMIPFFNKEFTIDEHCTLEPVIKPVTLTASRVAIGILALMIILKA